jgi:hypothetical protein
VSDVVQSVRQLLQNFIAPELRELKSDVKQLDAKIDLKFGALSAKLDSETGRLEEKVDSGLNRLEGKMDSDIKRLEGKMDSDFKRVEDKMDSGFAQMRTLLDNAYLRSELEATRDISNLRERVTRLEVERGAPRQ